MTYTIRIISPPEVTSSVETVPYPTVEEAAEAMQRLGRVLAERGHRTYEIHVINAATDEVVRTFSRAPDPTRVDTREVVV